MIFFRNLEFFTSSSNIPNSPSTHFGMFSRVPKTGVRAFSSSIAPRSNIGKLPIRIPEGVSCYSEILPQEFSKSFFKGKQVYSLDQQITIKGPLGELSITVPSFVKFSNDNNAVSIKIENENDAVQKSMWGTTRALIHNNVIGTSEGHLAIVKFVGTGFRATIEEGKDGKQVVALKIGLPYLPKVEVPKNIKVSSPNPARLLVEGLDKQQVKLFAARIREYKKPEPYKGKGIFVNDETIRLKEKKIK